MQNEETVLIISFQKLRKQIGGLFDTFEVDKLYLPSLLKAFL